MNTNSICSVWSVDWVMAIDAVPSNAIATKRVHRITYSLCHGHAHSYVRCPCPCRCVCVLAPQRKKKKSTGRLQVNKRIRSNRKTNQQTHESMLMKAAVVISFLMLPFCHLTHCVTQLKVIANSFELLEHFQQSPFECSTFAPISNGNESERASERKWKKKSRRIYSHM